MRDSYRTVRRPGKAEFRVLGSRFLASAHAVGDPEAAAEIVGRIRTEYHDATHVCYGYRIGEEEYRVSDAGEPSGTAGKPILGAIDRLGLVRVLVVVVRYFGGTKLGVGGLRRAYGDAAAAALEAAGSVNHQLVARVRVTVPTERVGDALHVIGRTGGRVLESTFAKRAEFLVEVRAGNVERLTSAMTESTAGGGTVEVLSTG